MSEPYDNEPLGSQVKRLGYRIMAVLIFIGVIVAMGIHVQLHFDAAYDHTDPANIARSINLYLADEL